MEIAAVIAAMLAGTAAGVGGTTLFAKRQGATGAQKAEEIIKKAKGEAQDLLLEAKDKALAAAEEANKVEQTRRKELKGVEQRIADREQSLDKKLDELDKRAERLRKEEAEVDNLKQEIRDIRSKQQEKLEKIAGLSKKEAAEKLMSMTERDIKGDLAGLVSKLQSDAERDAEERAQVVLVSAMERMASEVTAEKTVTAVKLEDEEMKGRIIGKEGRNIQALQRETGVDILVDDTPGMVVLSSFDPVRRQIARVSLEMLMKDGRIHPARIEEVVAKARKQIDKEIDQAGEDAAREVGIVGIPKEILRLLGELKFRTSYGQNVLKHSTEMAHIAGLIAEEIGADVRTAKYAALIHDMGKALTHKMEGKHHLWLPALTASTRLTPSVLAVRSVSWSVRNTSTTSAPSSSPAILLPKLKAPCSILAPSR